MKKRFLAFLLLISIMIVSCVSCTSNKNKTLKEDIRLNRSSEFDMQTIDGFDYEKVNLEEVCGKTDYGLVFKGTIIESSEKTTVITANISDGSIASEYEVNTVNFGTLIHAGKINDNNCFVFRKNDCWSLKILDQSGKVLKEKDLDYYPVDVISDDMIYVVHRNGDYPVVTCYDQDLTLISTNELHYNSEYGFFPQKLGVSENGKIYCLLYCKITSEYLLVSLSDSGENIQVSINDMNNIAGIFVDKPGTIYICGKENDYYMIDELDSTGKIKDLYEIKNCDSVYGVTESGIVCGNDHGLFLYNHESEKEIISNDCFEDKEIFKVVANDDTVTVFLEEEAEKTYDAVICSDYQGNITGVYPADNIVKCGVSGTEVFFISSDSDGVSNLYKISESETLETGVSYSGVIRDFKILNNGNLAVAVDDYDESVADLYDSNCNLIASANISDFSSFVVVDNQLYYTDNMNLYQLTDNMQIKKSDIDFSIFGDNPDFADGNTEYDLFFSNDSGIFGLDYKEMSCDKLLDYYQYGQYRAARTFIVDENSELILCSFPYAKIVKHRNKEELKKEKVSVAVFPDEIFDITVLSDAVNMINQNSDDYYIEIVSYNGNEENTAAELFERDVITGKIPDIICLNKKLNIKSFLKNNILTNMNYICSEEEDTESGIYANNVLNAFMYNDELYYFPVTFEYDTVVYNGFDRPANIDEYIKTVSCDVNLQYNSSGAFEPESLCSLYLSDHNAGNKLYPELDKNEVYDLISFTKKHLCFEYEELSEFPKYFADGSESFIDIIEFGDLSSYCQQLQKYGCDYKTGYSDSAYGLIVPRIGFSVTNQFSDKDFIKEFISEVMHQLENRGIGEGTAYIKKDWNTKLSDELSANEKERYLEAINANWKSDFLNFDIKELITEETYKIENDDITSKDSDNIYNKLKLYLDETK